ncbi:MAG: hypothetical protein QM776_04210 [Rhodocyclaceae bacterium]
MDFSFGDKQSKRKVHVMRESPYPEKKAAPSKTMNIFFINHILIKQYIETGLMPKGYTVCAAQQNHSFPGPALTPAATLATPAFVLATFS